MISIKATFKLEWILGLLALSTIILSCSKESEDIGMIDENDSLLFVIAGQSNAEGAVFLDGLEKLQKAIPQNTTTLNSAELTASRRAVAESLGVFCEVEFTGQDPNNPNIPFSFATADAVIDGLINSEIEWRSINDNYQHEKVMLIAANYYNANVEIVDATGRVVDNENCVFSPENTEIRGPHLNRYTANNIVSLTPGLSLIHI